MGEDGNVSAHIIKYVYAGGDVIKKEEPAKTMFE